MAADLVRKVALKGYAAALERARDDLRSAIREARHLPDELHGLAVELHAQASEAYGLAEALAERVEDDPRNGTCLDAQTLLEVLHEAAYEAGRAAGLRVAVAVARDMAREAMGPIGGGA